MSAACRCAAKSFQAPAISKSKCSTPIRGASSACASRRARNARQCAHSARAAAAKPRRSRVPHRPMIMQAHQPAMAGWWFGLGYFVPGLYWIGYAFLVDAPTFAWLMPFAVLGLPAYLALFPAFGFGLARLIWSKDGSRVIALAASLTASEWLRGHVLTGFPWNAFGYALTNPLALAQVASLIGLWGLTFL